MVWFNPVAGGALIIVGGALDAYSIKEAGKETEGQRIKSLSTVLLEYEKNSVIRWDPTRSGYRLLPRCDWLVDYQYDEGEEEKISAQLEIYNRLTKMPAEEVLKKMNVFSK